MTVKMQLVKNVSFPSADALLSADKKEEMKTGKIERVRQCCRILYLARDLEKQAGV